VTALQALPPRQLAVLVLRDVLGFHASEVAEMLDSTVESVSSALKRARAGLAEQRKPGLEEPPPVPGSSAEAALIARFVSAYESADVDALTTLFTDDIFVSMPPIPLEYQGKDAVLPLFASVFRSGRRFELVPTRANGQPAFGAYLRTPGARRGVSLIVLALQGDRVRACIRFDSVALPWFGLPLSLPDA